MGTENQATVSCSRRICSSAVLTPITAVPVVERRMRRAEQEASCWLPTTWTKPSVTRVAPSQDRWKDRPQVYLAPPATERTGVTSGVILCLRLTTTGGYGWPGSRAASTHLGWVCEIGPSCPRHSESDAPTRRRPVGQRCTRQSAGSRSLQSQTAQCFHRSCSV